MSKMLNLEYLKNYLPGKNDNVSKYRPECLYLPRPPARRKYQTAIRPPDRNFFDLMSQRDVYLWIVVKKNMNNDIKKQIEECYKSVKALAGFQNSPICTTLQQCRYWVMQCPCQIVVFEDAFQQTFNWLKDQQNASGFHIISADNIEIAKVAHSSRKIKNIYDDQKIILLIVKQNMERLAITRQERVVEERVQGGQQFKRLLLRNVVFPNFIKLSKHDKSEHNQYRLHLIGLRKLNEDDMLASKDKFIQCSRLKFPNDKQLIQQYYSTNFNDPNEILRFYTLDSFFYRVLNNTLRIAKNTQEFFSIGQPFNKVFDSIKKKYDEESVNIKEQIKVYRGADLTASQCQYLQQNIGRYIQINGFISTSKKQETAKNFALQRKNNSIFQIKLKRVPQKYKQYDYGYVDLQLSKCSAFDEDQVLINALNVFKITGKQKKQNFQFYQLQYGAIFDILQTTDPTSLSENDKFAYFSFKQLKQMHEEVKDIGQVYLRTNQPEKAVQIYQFQLDKIKNSVQPIQREDVQEAIVKAADAYLANGQPDKALQYYASIFNQKQQRNNIRKKSMIIQEKEKSKKEQVQLIEIKAKVSNIQNNTDKFQQAQLSYKKAAKQLQKQLEKQWNIEFLWPKVELEWQIIEGKKTQMLYEEAYNMLKQIDKTLRKALEKMKDKYEPYVHKKIRFKLTEVYQSMAQLTQQLQIQKSTIKQIKKSFDQTYSQIVQLIEQNSYQKGIINIRKSEIIRRTLQYNQTKQIQNYKSAILLITSNTAPTDTNIPKAYNSLATLHKTSKKGIDNIQAKRTYNKQLMFQTANYGTNDPRPLKTRMDIAICDRDDKNTIESIQQFTQAYQTKLYKTQNKYSAHAKILFNMGQAYNDKGDDGLALKTYKQAYAILQKRLSKNDFQKSVLKYKIKLKMGRLYMSSSLRTQTLLKTAKQYLYQYHNFVKDFYSQRNHSDVGLSYNCLGAYFSTVQQYKESKKKYIKSIQIYEYVFGNYSLDVAKIKTNLAICYAQQKQTKQATRTLKSAQQIFQKIYIDLRKLNPFQYQSRYIQGEIQVIDGKYQKAIQLCQLSKQLEKQFNEAKRKKNLNFGDTIHQQLGSNSKIDSMYLPQFQSLALNTKNKNDLLSPLKSDIYRVKSQNQRYIGNNASITSYITEHGFKCEFKICQCLMFLKRYEQAKIKLEKLRFDLEKRILEQKVNPLFKDSVYSKKSLYLKKCQQYIDQSNKRIQLLAKKQQKKRQKEKSNHKKTQVSKTQMLRQPPNQK